MTASPTSAPSTTYALDFEKPLLALEKQIEELERTLGRGDGPQGVNLSNEIRKVRESHTRMLRDIYSSLKGWDTVKVARHPNRPQAWDYINSMVRDFCELHGDRQFGDDSAIITGLGRIGTQKVLIVAQNKGKDTRSRLAANFGMAHPEGYRKALKKMQKAEKYGLPIVTLVDTPGAYPGVGAEERGQAEAIAVNLMEMSRLKVPIVSVVIGEGGSGGALGIGVADRVAMAQYAWYSVISPEACSSILWKSSDHAADAAEALKLTAKNNLDLGIIDHIIEEPLGGAHRNPGMMIDAVERWLTQSLKNLKRFKTENLLKNRYDRLRQIGVIQREQALPTS